SELSRVLLDIQHQAVTFTWLAQEEVAPARWRRLTPFDPSLISYKFMAEATDESFGDLSLDVDVTGIRLASPLWIETTIKVAKSASVYVGNHFKTLYRRIYFGDLERDRMRLENARVREEVIAARIANIEAAYRIDERVNDPAVASVLRKHLISAIAPFDPVLSSELPYSREKRKLVAAEIVESDGERTSSGDR